MVNSTEPSQGELKLHRGPQLDDIAHGWRKSLARSLARIIDYFRIADKPGINDEKRGYHNLIFT